MFENTELESVRQALSELIDNLDLMPNDPVQLQFAKLQLEQAQLCKDQATKYMDQIKQAQEEQKKCAEMIAQARKCQNQGKSGQGVGLTSIDGVKTTGKDCYPMPAELVEYMDKHELLYANSDKDHILGKDEWTQAIESLTKHQETIGTNTQQLMVFLQDFISQYNGYLQGANTQVANAAQVLSSITRGI